MILRLKFDARTIRKPVISIATLETNALINILRADVGAREGEMIVEVDDEKVKKVEEVLKRYGVEIQELGEGIVKDDSKCIHCGLCISVCPMEVFKFDENWRVVLDPKKCIHCGFCVKVCVTKALTLYT
ncbi:4Fe-4S binding protein [Archaeoglobus profundus]|uniref:4Fe-4S ferredoxin iron-sulfur binding domain protein n=1 Tax=Archaeoglobus profundus (strain DSM 5631 / JCM 9629 / NBRC 100127 / Av18) TaxID=572546 RepID=D2REA5_ARCPA|nr:4Fe-4S binding protein [Archaeoglobus profundus]ADB58449.1 4Fe-4S ferredoxin iron-sulfur binding domain protein [Archaeoglobus profundus DSM 5631]